MKISEWIDQTIAERCTKAVPIMTHPGIELTGNKVRDAVTDGRIHFEAIRALNERFPQSAACTVIMDLTVEAESFGAPLRMPDNEVPSVAASIVSSMEQIEALRVPPLESGRIPAYLEANRLAALRIDKPVFGGCIGPFSLAGRLFDMTEIMMAIYIDPDAIRELLRKCAAFIGTYLAAIKETGAAGVIMAEPAAGLLPNDDCREFSSVYIKELIDAVQDDSFAVILHNCGNSGHCTSAMTATGAMGYHFGNRMDMVQAADECPPDALVMGNLDPVGVFKSAAPDEVKCRVQELLHRMKNYPNFVLSSGCDTPPGVPFENIEAFYEALSDAEQ